MRPSVMREQEERTIGRREFLGGASAAALAGALAYVPRQRKADADISPDIRTVKEFGAVGDGVADDTAKLQNAINGAASTTGHLYVKKGNYKYTGTLNIPSDIHIEGEQMGSGANLVRAANVLGISLAATAPNRVWHPSLERLRFSGGNFSADHMRLTNISHLLMKDCYFYNAAGRHLLATSLWDSRLYNCVFHTGGSPTMPMVTFTGTGGDNITNQNHLYGLHLENYRGIGIEITGGTMETYFYGAKLEGTPSNTHHMKIDGGTAVELHGVQFTAAGTSGNTIPELLLIQNVRGVQGDIQVEHLGFVSSAANINRYVKITNSSHIDLSIMPYADASKWTGTEVVGVDGLNRDSIEITGPPFFNGKRLINRPMVTYGSATPSSLRRLWGDRQYSTAPTNTVLGWVCTASGTPGTWRTF